MSTFTFSCHNPDCASPIQALITQGGMRISCATCGTSNAIPQLSVPTAAPPPPPSPREATPEKRTLLDQAKRAGEDYLREEAGPLGGILLGKKKPEPAAGIATETTADPDRPSFIDRAYAAIGNGIDRLLAGDHAEDSFKGRLQSARAAYLGLSPFRRRHLTFFISLALVLVVFWIWGGAFAVGAGAAVLFAGFVALNQLKFLNRIFNVITEIIVTFTVFFLPDGFKDVLSSLLKYVVYFILVIWVGEYLALPYIAYKLFLVIADKTEV